MKWLTGGERAVWSQCGGLGGACLVDSQLMCHERFPCVLQHDFVHGVFHGAHCGDHRPLNVHLDC